MKEDDTQIAAMLSLDAQSIFDVRFIVAPFPCEGVCPLSEWIGMLSKLPEPEKHPSRAKGGKTSGVGMVNK